MKRKTLDLVVPFTYALAVIIAGLFRNDTALGAVAVFGAMLVALYYAAFRENIK